MENSDPRKWIGLPDLQAHLRPMEALKHDPENARKHSERQLTALQNALNKLGQHRPLVVNSDGQILIGNGLYTAAQRLGWTHVAAIETDEPKTEAHLRALTDNEISDLASWDQQRRCALITDLNSELDLKLYGFTQSEIDRDLKMPHADDIQLSLIEDLAAKIETEAPVDLGMNALELAQRLSDKISKRLHTLALERPKALTQAQGFVIDRQGGKPLFVLMDPNTRDTIAELKRLVDDPDAIPEGSPLAALMEAMNV
jgi:hypothetical protein